MPETINHPAHYGGDTAYEAIKVIEAWELDFCLGNTVKYISRAGRKTADQIEDLQKARWYLDRKIAQLRRAGGTSQDPPIEQAPSLDCSNPKEVSRG